MPPSRGASRTQSSATAVPGVSKIKAAIRQTTRLLAKDKLAADVRVETERRLKSLQGDLEIAERGKKDRALAIRYHKVKFFERQKACRKVNSTKRKIADPTTHKKARAKLELDLLEHRINLNYVLHYPRSKKYIALFPPAPVDSVTTPKASASTSDTDATRNQLREWVRTAMKNGEMDSEPEVTMSKGTGDNAGVQWDPEVDEPDDAGDADDDNAQVGSDDDAVPPLTTEIPAKTKVKLKDKSKKSKKAKESQSNETVEKPNLGIKGDEFFDSGDE